MRGVAQPLGPEEALRMLVLQDMCAAYDVVGGSQEVLSSHLAAQKNTQPRDWPREDVPADGVTLGTGKCGHSPAAWFERIQGPKRALARVSHYA